MHNNLPYISERNPQPYDSTSRFVRCNRGRRRRLLCVRQSCTHSTLALDSLEEMFGAYKRARSSLLPSLTFVAECIKLAGNGLIRRPSRKSRHMRTILSHLFQKKPCLSVHLVTPRSGSSESDQERRPSTYNHSCAICARKDRKTVVG